MKKIISFTVLGLLFIALFFGAWWFLTRGEDGASNTFSDEKGTFNPFGFFSDTENQTDGSSETPSPFFDNQESTASGISFLQITSAPTAGVATLQTRVGTSTYNTVRYVEKETGHVYDYTIETREQKRVSNTTIPRVQEAIFGNGGGSVALRRIQDDGETVETFFGKIDAFGTDTPLSGSFLPINALVVAVNPAQHEIFYMLETGAGVARGMIMSEDTSRALVAHPFSQWQVAWATSTSILLTTAPSYATGGVLFTLDSVSGSFDRVSPTIPALTALPSVDGRTVLTGFNAPRSASLSLYDISTQQTSPISLNTLPEKCAWAGTSVLFCAVPNISNQRLPDDWYQGIVSFLDTFWKIETETGYITYLGDPTDAIPDGIDAMHLSAFEDGNHFVFINKKDRSLWLVDVSRFIPPPYEELSYE